MNRAKTSIALQETLASTPGLDFGVLIGSRALGTARVDSDWDIALQWSPGMDAYALLGHTETLRHDLAQALEVADTKVDLIDLRRAGLAMRSLVARQGILLVLNNPLRWAKFLERTWRDEEDFAWERGHVA